MNWLRIAAFSAFLLTGLFVWAQEPAEEEDDTPITGGITYSPVVPEDELPRDPFKSPFEIEKEREATVTVATGIPNAENRLPHSISEMDLKGIYLDARTGYWAIFSIGGEYDWFQVGTLLRDADLVNITDKAVFFKHYTSEDSDHIREVVKELHRGEE
ncbi:hypothetical protein [Acanthopleuribacter pedis]|uniref:Uncharacterized protein n=1 Tax=Acanthopleuribacter pedis TaxID=442870 RepID=A0A8J7QKP9_9BACT|nr:hypothetical protein [Acanthopleuribacter pedis]MBO1320003.1 hypothetical protein [Acanthopleuribacter pedis]